MTRRFTWALAIAVGILSAPLAGAWTAGRPLVRFLEFPPKSLESADASYDPVAWWILAGAGFLLAALWRILRRSDSPEAGIDTEKDNAQVFPAWGYLCLAWTVVWWVLAWTRFAWMEPWQAYTFTPLWIGYIGCLQAAIQQRTGSCPLLRDPARFLRLFPASALFWWIFEYLNRYVANWRYLPTMEALSTAEYTVHATISFSTVLPAVYSTYLFLLTVPALRVFLSRGPEVPWPDTPGAGAGFFLAGFALLFGVGFRPEAFFPALWVAPILLFAAYPDSSSTFRFLAGLRQGDWRQFGSWALAALVCGFFWEMWNFHSLARWEYAIPHFHRYEIFEMPLLGYFGYLPFGILCGMAVSITVSLSGRKR